MQQFLFAGNSNGLRKVSGPGQSLKFEFWLLQLNTPLKKSYEYISDEHFFGVIGFDPVDNERIFAAFARLNSKNVFDGTGLGLSLCRKIIERHKGTITARGEHNNGTTFTIRLPLKKA